MEAINPANTITLTIRGEQHTFGKMKARHFFDIMDVKWDEEEKGIIVSKKILQYLKESAFDKKSIDLLDDLYMDEVSELIWQVFTSTPASDQIQK